MIGKRPKMDFYETRIVYCPEWRRPPPGDLQIVSDLVPQEVLDGLGPGWEECPIQDSQCPNQLGWWRVQRKITQPR